MVGEFANAHPKYKDSFMVFCDPDTNTVVGAYRGMISGFQNKSKEKTLRDLFRYDARDDQINGNRSKRNMALYNFIGEIDGMIDSFAKKFSDLKQGAKDLARLEKRGMLKVGSQKVSEKGNATEIAVVR